jgi:hypothetical protein
MSTNGILTIAQKVHKCKGCSKPIEVGQKMYKLGRNLHRSYGYMDIDYYHEYCVGKKGKR